MGNHLSRISVLRWLAGIFLLGGCGNAPGQIGEPFVWLNSEQLAGARHSKLDEALIKAIWGRDSEEVGALLKRGASANARDDFGVPVLTLAAGDGQVTSAEALLAAGAQVSQRDPDNRTALMDGAQSGVSAIVELLIRAKAEINAKDNLHWTALHGAAFFGKPETTKALIVARADIDARTDRDKTALDLASEMGHDEVIQILRDATPSATIPR